MNLANLMQLTNVEMGLIVVEVSILFSLCLMYRLLKRMRSQRVDEKHPHLDSNQLKTWLQESEAVCEGFSKNLKEKREIAQQLIGQLDRKIELLGSQLKKLDEGGISISQGIKGKNLEAQILQMAQAGVDISDIARQLKISKGEVQLTLDLKRYCQ
jgi:hypothetical protein